MCVKRKRVVRSWNYTDGDDLISELADEVLIQILSLLGAKEAASTDVLSRRWRHLWKSTSRLNFHYIPTDTKPFLHQRIAKFVHAVNQTINLHTSSTLKEFQVRYDMDSARSDGLFLSSEFEQYRRLEMRKLNESIPWWLEFALAKTVEILDLDLTQKNRSVLYPALPPYLQIMSCPHQFPGFSSLRDLSFKGINIPGQVLEFFLNNCPLLERLSVYGSKELGHLRVDGPSLVLKSLEICDCICDHTSRIEIVNATTLTRLIYTGSSINWSVKNVPLLVEVCVGGPYPSTFKKCYEPISVSGCFWQLQTLTICIHNEDGFAHFNSNKLLLPCLQKMVLKYRVSHDGCILHYTRLIEASPLLKKFALHMTWITVLNIDTQRKQQKKVGVKFHHKHLEEVELAGYYGLKSDLELVHYFIHNALSLKKLVIDPRNQQPRSTFPEADIFKRERDAVRAKQQLEPLVPSGVQLEFIHSGLI